MKTRKNQSGEYEIVGTPLLVVKDQAPKFGMAQEWSVVHRDDPHWALLTGKGMHGTLRQLEDLLNACGAQVPA